eukprot:5884578-Prymnesium_polylepis.1
MSDDLLGQRNKPDSALAAWSRLSAATLRPASVRLRPGSPMHQPARGACAPTPSVLDGERDIGRARAARPTRDRKEAD